jgi:hypothetical protein
MILSVVADRHHATTGPTTGLLEPFRKLPEGFPVESSGLALEQKLAISQADGGEVADTFPRRMMIHNRVSGFRRHPHSATGTLLLKMHFVQRPEIYAVVAHQLAEFFL